ncbi:MAG: pitrilysin family protein [Patescibacteria group bacterium]
MINYKKKVSKNGLRVIVAPMESTQAVTLMVLVGVGSRYETKNINGISHFLEHLFFKGTKSRPKLGQVHKDLDRIGATHNAFTSKETTGFWVKSSAKDFDTSLDIVSDILLEPLFDKDEIEKERGVILQEISMYEDEPRRKVWEVLENTMYGDQPVGWDIAGTVETVSNIKRKDITDYKKNNYLARNMIVVVAGNVDEGAFEKVEKHFSKISLGKNKSAKKVVFSQTTAFAKILQKDSDQTHLAIGLKGYDMFDEKRFATDILAVMLGGNTSSRLFMEIREKLGLAYYVGAMNDMYSDCGYIGIGAGIAHEQLGKTVEKIGEILSSLKTKGVSKSELDFAKGFLRGQLALKMETSDEVAGFCAGQELFYKKIEQPESFLKKIEKVTQNDILRVTRDIFRNNKINVAVIGAQEDLTEKELCKKIL